MRSTVLLSLALATASSHAAVTILDTGEPPARGVFGWAVAPWQWLGAEFTSRGTTTILDIQSFLVSPSGGPLELRLYEGNPLTGSLLESITFDIPPAPAGLPVEPSWQSFSGLDWGIGPGNYTIAFVSSTNQFYGSLPYPAPNPVTKQWVYQPETGWTSQPIDPFGVRVTASVVPEPSTAAFLFAGSALVIGIGGRASRERAGRTSSTKSAA